MIVGLSAVEKELSNSMERNFYLVVVLVLYTYPGMMNAYDYFQTNTNTIHSVKKNCQKLYTYKMLEIRLGSYTRTTISKIGQLS